MKKSTRRQDYVSKNSIFNDFINRAAARQYKIQLAKEFKLQREKMTSKKAEEADKAEPVTGEVIE